MERAVEELEKLNSKADKIIAIMEKPENRFMKVMVIVGNAVTIAGIIAIAEIIRNWIIGG